MGAIFLSYAREDRDRVENLARVLGATGHDVWWDKRLDGGEEFSAEIEAALEKSDVVVVAWSKESVRSRWVRDEAAVGGDTGRLVPVTIDGSLPPMGFRQFHTLDLADWKGAKRDRRTAELLHSVERRLQAKGAAPSASSTTKPNPRSALQLRKWPWPTIAMLVLLVGAATAFFFATREQTSGSPQKPAIALLPFNGTSSDPELLDLAAQTRNSIAQIFSQSGLPVQLLSSNPQGRPAADFLFGGDFSRNGDRVQATIRLDEAAHGVTVYSRQFDAQSGDVRNLPERIGVQLAEKFTGSQPLAVLDRRRPLDPPLLADLLTDGVDLHIYQVRKRDAAQLPNVAVAQLGFALFTSFVLRQLPHAERAEALAEGRRAADRSMALDPSFADNYFAWCLLHSEVRLIECEDRLRAGRRVNPDVPNLNRHLAWLLRDVGRSDEAAELTSLSFTDHPYNAGKLGDMLWVLEYTGDDDGARQLYEKGVRWFPESKSAFAYNRLWGLVDSGNFDAIPRLEEQIGPGVLPSDDLKGRALLTLINAKTVPAAKKICLSATGDNKILCMLRLSSLGDQDDAFAIAAKLYPRRVGRSPAETEQIWIDEPDGGGFRPFITSPAAAPMRRDPRYLGLAQRVGLLDYWRSGRPPDFCRKQPEPICPQLLNAKH